MAHSTVKNSLKEGVIQIGAGGSAGFVEVCIMHPMDLVKTRFQLQVKTTKLDPLYYTGISDCMAKMYKSEGLTAFWKGILPPIIVETPKRAVKVAIGFVSGTVASCLNIPFDVAKSRIQGSHDSTQYKGTLNTMYIVYKREGFRALYKGLLPKVLRLGPGGAIMLVVYDYMHVYLMEKFKD